ncbi:hypothetical protein H4R19_007318 [Coemansia spiralis]|nr:hypothetical protein H4R19_007318 [Coemansia spiralis]
MQGLTLLALVGYGVYGASSMARERRADVREIDWEKLERQAKEAEAAAAAAPPPSHADPATAMLIDKAKERKSVFASDDRKAQK